MQVHRAKYRWFANDIMTAMLVVMNKLNSINFSGKLFVKKIISLTTNMTVQLPCGYKVTNKVTNKLKNKKIYSCFFPKQLRLFSLLSHPGWGKGGGGVNDMIMGVRVQGGCCLK